MHKASDNGVKSHPQKTMKDLGISYQYSVPQSISDSWEFWNCENVPEDIPGFLKIVKWNPMDHVGYGLNIEQAKQIRDYKGE